MNVKEFAEAYNRNIDWNRDIRSTLGSNSIDNSIMESDEVIVDILDEFLPTEKITEESCDFDSAEIYDCHDGKTTELQIYNYDDCHGAVYWVRPDQTESDYKKSKVDHIKKTIAEKHAQLISLVTSLNREINSLSVLEIRIKNNIKTE